MKRMTAVLMGALMVFALSVGAWGVTPATVEILVPTTVPDSMYATFNIVASTTIASTATYNHTVVTPPFITRITSTMVDAASDTLLLTVGITGTDENGVAQTVTRNLTSVTLASTGAERWASVTSVVTTGTNYAASDTFALTMNTVGIDATGGIAAAIDLNAASSGSSSTGWTPDWPRSLRINAVENSGTSLTVRVWINGTNQFGETVAGGFNLKASLMGLELPQVYGSVTSYNYIATNAAASDTLEIGWGPAFGLYRDVTSANSVLKALSLDSTDTDTVSESTVLNAQYNSWTPAYQLTTTTQVMLFIQ